mmetsp:Transcript_18986/g.52951  ORF Transcript_18986/g.52951 Transcript_18986/m.52951 type:complete len:204 (-) Transcript_18986:480-1091(-)
MVHQIQPMSPIPNVLAHCFFLYGLLASHRSKSQHHPPQKQNYFPRLEVVDESIFQYPALVSQLVDPGQSKSVGFYHCYQGPVVVHKKAQLVPFQPLRRSLSDLDFLCFQHLRNSTQTQALLPNVYFSNYQRIYPPSLLSFPYAQNFPSISRSNAMILRSECQRHSCRQDGLTFCERLRIDEQLVYPPGYFSIVTLQREPFGVP